MSTWTKQEELDLIKIVGKMGNSWTEISQNFPNRSPGSLKKHYALMKSQKKDEAQIENYSMQEEKSPDEIINDILRKKITDNDKIQQLHNFDNTLVFRIIIDFSNDFPSSCPSMAMLLRSMFGYEYFSKNIFLAIANESKCLTLLQFCRCFTIINDEEFRNITYVQNDIFFFKGPIFKINSRDDILEKARNEKKDKSNSSPIQDLQTEIARLNKTIYELNHQNFLLNQKVANLIQKINDPFEERNLHKGEICLPSEMLIKYPIIKCMINKFLNKKSGDTFYKFCSLIHILNSKAYLKLYEFIPLLSESSCYSFISPIKTSLANMIMNYEYIPNIIHKFYEGLIEFDESNKAETPIFVTLAGNAASLKNIYRSSFSTVYTFEMRPLKKDYPPCVVYMMETNNGSSPPKVVNMFPKITKCLNQHNFIVKFQGTDGDVSFDATHRDFFIKHIQPIINSNFIETIDHIKEFNSILVSDPMHLIKSGRSRLLQHLLLIDPDSCKCINTALFSKAVELGPVFSDKSQSGAMKDNYALSIFSWYSFVRTMEKGRFDAAYYILPFLFLIESIRSPLLSNETRLEFLSYSFEIFRDHLNKIKKIDNDSLFKQRFTSKSLGVLFSDEIFLYRIFEHLRCFRSCN